MLLTAGRAGTSYRDVLKEMHDAWRWLAWDTPPGDAALSKARGKLSSQACRSVWQQAVKLADGSRKAQGKGPLGQRRAVGVDGTWMYTPSTAGTRKQWGQPTGAAGMPQHNPQLLLVAAWDLVTRIPLAASVLRHDDSERLGARRLFADLQPGDVLIWDRGYPGKTLFLETITSGFDFIARMTTSEANSWDAVYRFLRSGQDDAIVAIDFGDGVPRNVRLVRRRFARGRPKSGQSRDRMVIMTTLLDTTEFPAERIIDLYAQRWGIETRFRELKVQYGIEAFHANSVEGILQELYAILVWMTISAVIEARADHIIAEQHGPQSFEDPHRRHIRRTSLFSSTKRIFLAAWKIPDHLHKLEPVIDEEAAWLARFAAKRRPGRSSPRVTKRPHGRFK
jgi:Transposase DDE domain